jgi:hypothetical protein
MIILVSREVNLVFVTKLLCFDYVLDIYCAMEVAMLRQAFRQTVSTPQESFRFRYHY